MTDLSQFYNQSASTNCIILKKDEIKAVDAAKGITRISKQWPRVLEDVEKLLLTWIKEKQLASDTVTKNIMCEKARALHADVVSKTLGASQSQEECFKAS